MENEFFYLNELQLRMQEFLETHLESLTDDQYGYFGNDLAATMAKAAWNIIAYGKTVNDIINMENLNDETTKIHTS